MSECLWKWEQSESKVRDLLLIGEVSVPSSDDVAIHLGVFQVAAFKRIDLPFQVHQRLLWYYKQQIQIWLLTDLNSTSAPHA